MQKYLLSLLAILLLASNAFGATNNWQTGGVDTNWNTAGNWSDGVPTADDDCILGAGDQAMTINAAAVCRSLDASAYNNTITHNAGITLTIGDASAGAGNVALAFNSVAGGMTYTLVNATTSAISFQSTYVTTPQTINFNGQNTGNVTFGATSVAGNYQLTGAWGTSGVNASQITNLTKGTLDTNGQTIYWGGFNSNNSNVRTLILGASNITNLYSGVAWSVATSLNFTAGTSSITFSGSNVTFSGATETYNVVNFTGSADVIIGAAAGNPTFGTLNRTGTASKSDSLIFYGNPTVTGTLNLDGNSSINRLLIRTTTLGSPQILTITGATISGCSNVDFRDITFTSTGAMDFSAITGGSGDCGGNTVAGGGTLTLTTADDWYWNGSGTRNFSDYTYWYDQTNGGGSQMASTRCPLPQDTCYINGDSIDGATTIDQNMPRVCKTLDFTGCAAMAFHMNNINQTIYGGLIFSNNVTLSSINTYSVTFGGRDTYNINSSGKYLQTNIYFNAISGTYILTGKFCQINSDFNVGLNINNGVFDADIYDVDFASFTASGTSARTILMGSGTWTGYRQFAYGEAWDITTTTNLSNPTTLGETSTIVFAQTTAYSSYAYGFSGGGCTYNNFTANSGSANFAIKGSNTFNTLTINAPKTVKFTEGTTQTVNSFITANTSPSNKITLSSTTSAKATLKDMQGVNSLKNCNISNLTATGLARWEAYEGTTNKGNNYGFIFYPGVNWTRMKQAVGGVTSDVFGFMDSNATQDIFSGVI